MWYPKKAWKQHTHLSLVQLLRAQLREIKGLCLSRVSLSKALYQCLAEKKTKKHANCFRTLHSSTTKTTLRSSDVRVKKSRMLSTTESFLTNMHLKLQLYVHVGWLMIILTDFRNLTSANIFLFNFDSPSLDFCKFWLLCSAYPWGRQTILPPCWTDWDPVLYEPNEPRCSPRFQSMTNIWHAQRRGYGLQGSTLVGRGI